MIAEHERILSAIEAHDAERSRDRDGRKHIERLLGDIAGIKNTQSGVFRRTEADRIRRQDNRRRLETNKTTQGRISMKTT